MKAYRWAAAALVIGLASCGKTKLNGEQQSQVQRLTTSVARGGGATYNAQPGGAPVIEGLRGALSALNVIPDGKVTNQTELISIIRKRNCVFANSFDAAALSGSVSLARLKDMSFQVSGANCPIVVGFDVKVNAGNGGKSGSIGFNLNYEVRDVDFRKLNDVTKLTLNGELKISGDESGGEMTLNLSGEIVSTEFGTIPLSLSAELNASKGAVTWKMTLETKFKTFDFELAAESNGKEIEYSLNGEKKTQKEIQDFFKEAKAEAPPLTKNPASPPGGGSLSPAPTPGNPFAGGGGEGDAG